MFIGGRKFLIDVYFLAKPDFLGGVVVLDVAGMQHLAFASIPAPQKMGLESFNFLLLRPAVRWETGRFAANRDRVNSISSESSTNTASRHPDQARRKQ